MKRITELTKLQQILILKIYIILFYFDPYYPSLPNGSRSEDEYFGEGFFF